MNVIESVRQRIIGTLALKTDPKLTEFESRTRDTPVYEAYQEYMEATELFMVYRDYKAAIEHCEKALEIDPTLAVGYNLLAYELSRRGNHQKAISTIKKYISLQPDEWNPYDSAWEIYMKAGLYDEAIGICRQALKISQFRLCL